MLEQRWYNGRSNNSPERSDLSDVKRNSKPNWNGGGGNSNGNNMPTQKKGQPPSKTPGSGIHIGPTSLSHDSSPPSPATSSPDTSVSTANPPTTSPANTSPVTSPTVTSPNAASDPESVPSSSSSSSSSSPSSASAPAASFSSSSPPLSPSPPLSNIPSTSSEVFNNIANNTSEPASQTASSTFQSSMTNSLTGVSTTPSLSGGSNSVPQSNALGHHTNKGAIAGGVVGGLAFLLLIALSIVFFLRRRRRNRTPASAEFREYAGRNAQLLGSYTAARQDSAEVLDAPPPFTQGDYSDPLFEKLHQTRQAHADYGVAI